MNGKVLMLAIIFFGGFHVFYAFNRVQNFANIMYRLCAIQLGECPNISRYPIQIQINGRYISIPPGGLMEGISPLLLVV